MSTTLLQITAQYYENYGAHSWDGQGECPQHWKPKGGQIFTLRVDSDSFMYAEEQCIKAIATLLEKQSNNYERYTYVDHELVFSEPIVLDDAEFDKELTAECEKAFK
jgi:hypothetical protein